MSALAFWPAHYIRLKQYPPRGKEDHEHLVQKSCHTCNTITGRLLRASSIELARGHRAKQLMSCDRRQLYHLREWAPGMVGRHARLLSAIQQLPLRGPGCLPQSWRAS